jgi:rod shape-determining protein MreC
MTLLTIRSQIRERDELATQLRKLESQYAASRDAAEQNEQLRKLLDLKKNAGFASIASSVTSRDPSGITSSIVLDKGRTYGISTGDAVVDPSGALVGVVKDIYDSSCKVLLITDGLVKIDARILDRDAVGLVAGSHRLGLSLELVSKEVDLKPGDKIVTSGLTGTMPAGLLIGYVDETLASRTDLFKQASVRPAADLKDLRFVLVVTGF